MFQLVVKNTFVAVEEMEEQVQSSSPTSARSRSMPCESSRGAMTVGVSQLTQQQLEKLNSLLTLDTQDALAVVKVPLSPRKYKPTAQQKQKHEKDIDSTYEHRTFNLKNASQGLRGSSNMSLSTLCPEDGQDDMADFEIEMTIEEEKVAPKVSSQALYTSTEQHSPSLKPQQRDYYLHKCVPKNVDLAQAFQKTAVAASPTTMMIRNIPNRYTQSDLLAELESAGFADTFDFLYLPVDRGTMGSVGYAFVNFIDHVWAAKCKSQFEGHRFRGHRRNSGKPAKVSVAHLQGLEANLRHYERAAVSLSEEKALRPMVKANLARLVQ
jgi:hypothetical protein